MVKSFTEARRRPTELGRLPGLALPWTFSLAQVGVVAAGLAAGGLASRLVGHWWPLAVVFPPALLAARLIRRVKLDERPFLRGAARRLSWWRQRGKYRSAGRRSADAVVGNAVVAADHSVWLLFAVEPAHYGRLSDVSSALAALTRAERFVQSVGVGRWRLMSVLEDLGADEIARRMSGASSCSTWRTEVDAWEKHLGRISLTERKFWLLAEAGRAVPPGGDFRSRVKSFLGWRVPARAGWVNGEELDALSAELVARSGGSLPIRPATAEEATGLLDRVPVGNAPRVKTDVLEDYDFFGPAVVPGSVRVGQENVAEGASAWTLGRADWLEPRRGMCVAELPGGERVAHLTAAVAAVPNSWWVPGGGEFLWRLDALADPWDWMTDVKVTPHAVAAARARNKERALAGQYGEYAGDMAGAPPDLDLAMTQIRDERAALAANRDSDEYTVTVLVSTAVRVEADGEEGLEAAAGVLEERFHRLRSAAAAVSVSVVAPAGDQVDGRAAWFPSASGRGPVLTDYRQYLLGDGLAGLAPCQQAKLGDPQGTFLGVSDERGYLEPVLFDPTLGPRAAEVGGSPKSPSIGVSGRLGSGKSVLCKRSLWTSLAAGGSAVVVDRSESGEYVAFAKAVSALAPELSVEVIDVTDPEGASIDPLRTIPDASAAAETAVRLLCFMSNLDPRSSVAARIARAARAAGGASMLRMLEEEADGDVPEWAAVLDLAEVLAADKTGGALFDPERRPGNLTADLVVLWCPGLSLVSSPDTPSDVAATAVVLGTMLVARALIFASAERYAMLLLDEAWSLFPDKRALSVVVEALRDGRKHNSAVCLATQSPSDFGISPELAQLLGYVALFGTGNMAAAEEGAALFGVDGRYASALVGLPTGTMLWRDVFGRVGLVETWLPADPRAAAAIDTTPGSYED